MDSKTLLTRSVAYSYTNLRSASVRNSVSKQSNTAHPHCFLHSNYNAHKNAQFSNAELDFLGVFAEIIQAERSGTEG